MTRFAVFDLASLPYPGVVETLDIEPSSHRCAMTSWPGSRRSSASSTLKANPPASSSRSSLTGKCCWRARINDAARQRMLAIAAGSNLDAIAAYYGVSRFEGEPDTSLRRRTQLAPEACRMAERLGSYKLLALQAAFQTSRTSLCTRGARGHVESCCSGTPGRGPLHRKSRACQGEAAGR